MKKGSLIDVSGAEGYFGKVVRESRPDINITINDILSKACQHASSLFGFETIFFTISDLVNSGKSIDMVSLIGVIYNEDDVQNFYFKTLIK